MCNSLRTPALSYVSFMEKHFNNTSATSGNKDFKRNQITNILPVKRHQMWCKPQRKDSLRQVTLSPTTVPHYYQAAVYTSFQLHHNLQAN